MYIISYAKILIVVIVIINKSIIKKVIINKSEKIKESVIWRNMVNLCLVKSTSQWLPYKVIGILDIIEVITTKNKSGKFGNHSIETMIVFFLNI